MTDSTGNGEKKVKKAGPATTIAAITALLAAGGTFVKDVKGQHDQDLIQESAFNYAMAEMAKQRERIARLETHIEWLRGGVMEDMMPAMATMVPECSMDDDCGVTEHCIEGMCQEPVAEEAPPVDAGSGGGGGGGGGHMVVVVEEAMPPPAPPSRKPRSPKLDKFEDLKDFVQTEQRAWAAE